LVTKEQVIQLAFCQKNVIKDDYLHKASRNIIDYAVETSSGLIIIGENKHWKQEINIGKKNQNFVSIPYDKFKAMIECRRIWY